jgi:hypothetical protein
MRISLEPRRRHVESLVQAAVLILLLAASLGTVAVGSPGQFNAGPNPMHQNPRPALPETIEPPTDVPPLSPSANARRQRDLTKSNYEKLKQEADELADLAKSLQDDLSNSNADVLSLKVVQRAEKIEKLAKKIRGSAVENTN